ncbi:hypothetical protein LCGC14_2385870 [marine sediment metagenome]|uniref:Uncharacterized protein n=1 Tax=marine sediment metagenome TaxID=412755 RepID=A0A0F9CLR5_9ZZZZ
MPTYVYHCPDHGEFEIIFSLKEEVPTYAMCPREPEGVFIVCAWKPQVVNFTVEGGTGAARGAANR